MPLFLRNYGPAVAFGIPGILMFIATMIFWLGRRQYVRVPPTHGEDPDSFLQRGADRADAQVTGRDGPASSSPSAGAALAVAMLLCWAIGPAFWPEDFGFVITACLALGALIAFGGIGTSMQLERARGRHPDEAVDSVRAVLRILIVFALTTPFWSLFDQKASTWVLQGKTMVRAARPVVVAELAGEGSRADAGAEPAAGDADHPVQQHRAVSGAAAHGLGADGAAAHGLGHRVRRLRLDRARA